MTFNTKKCKTLVSSDSILEKINHFFMTPKIIILRIKIWVGTNIETNMKIENQQI
jgi:hypothetical protein